MIRHLLVALTAASLFLTSCVTTDDPPASTEDVAHGDQDVAVTAPFIIAPCLIDPPCAVVLFAAVGAIYVVSALTAQQMTTAVDAILSWQAEQEEVDCPENAVFRPTRTDDALGCRTPTGQLRCYSRRHPPCTGVHTHGIRDYQEVRGGKCVKVSKKFVRCDGLFVELGACVGSTVECGKEGTRAVGFFPE